LLQSFITINMLNDYMKPILLKLDNSKQLIKGEQHYAYIHVSTGLLLTYEKIHRYQYFFEDRQSTIEAKTKLLLS